MPGKWLGIVGGGQLGRMFCFAAQAMGYRVAVLDPESTCPAGGVVDRHLCAEYNNREALSDMAGLCAAVSTEFENVPAASLDWLARSTCVSPSAQCVAIAQDRIAEKRCIEQAGVPVAPYIVIESSDVLQTLCDKALLAVLPSILKTARLGYDGRGQRNVCNPDEVRAAYIALGSVACILEQRLPLAYEISVIIARSADGTAVMFPVAQNIHRTGILSQTISPTPVGDAALIKRVQAAALSIAIKLDHVGVLCVEFFVLQDGSLVANEIAPRPHNSGHYTINACVSNQFEQQVRAMTGMPLGCTRQHSPAVMLNLLGDVWFSDKILRVPPWHKVAEIPGAHLHLYAKAEVRIGRKMGHLTLTAPTLCEAQTAARTCMHLLHIPSE
ncbi:5-(carboxyamino)imidazole ribonucleotide synthase [Candidatus Vallotiella sp. (ex Adelges kitamiensis)]|uniref:5-(carboxyamino)imidazole ribonucleotide synthase n=1 Tax=Candidatus Vallotiella sp. (ex Adelges kitamiensis) TaxID=2864217 RepID=UPI001CE23FE4|nr:5-(carboxyamino)imidazole ribonucleotide synthase [Candidatus Vallotia sp. (ex Adelges kitamiensis)]